MVSSLPELPTGELQEHVLEGSGNDLETSELDAPGANADIWEKVARRLRLRAMPPATAPQPTRAEREDFVAGSRIPQLDRAVGTGGGEAFPVATEGEAVDAPGVARTDHALAIGETVASGADVGVACRLGIREGPSAIHVARGQVEFVVG